MSTIGAEDLLREYGSRLGVAKAYIQGKISYDAYVGELLGRMHIAAAEAALRLERGVCRRESAPVKTSTTWRRVDSRHKDGCVSVESDESGTLYMIGASGQLQAYADNGVPEPLPAEEVRWLLEETTR